MHEADVSGRHIKGNRIVIQSQTYTCIYFQLCLEILNNNDYTVVWRVYPLLFVPALTLGSHWTGS